MIGVDEWNRVYGHKSRGLGGAVSDGDTAHEKHSHMVGACGTWLQGQVARTGGLVYATYTGRPTGKGTYGTPGIPDLAGWAMQTVTIEASVRLPSWIHLVPVDVPMPLYVECKVLPDKLNEAQKAFRKEAEAAGVRYFCVHWSGDPKDDPVADLRERWKDGAALAAAEGEGAT